MRLLEIIFFDLSIEQGKLLITEQLLLTSCNFLTFALKPECHIYLIFPFVFLNLSCIRDL